MQLTSMLERSAILSYSGKTAKCQLTFGFKIAKKCVYFMMSFRHVIINVKKPGFHRAWSIYICICIYIPHLIRSSAALKTKKQQK